MIPFLPPELTNYYKEIEQYVLNYEVISCVQAAKAKKIPLENELKSLLLITSSGFLIAHVPGDKKLNNRYIKSAIQCKNVSLASPLDLKKLDLSPGTICAIRDPIWSMTHLISEEVLEKSYISTNDGTRTGFFRFNPKILLLSNSHIIGQYSKELLQ